MGIDLVLAILVQKWTALALGFATIISHALPLPVPTEVTNPVSSARQFTFHTVPDLLCDDHPPYLLTVVHSHAENFAHRKAIRQTWASTQNGNTSFKVIFLVGLVDKSKSQDTITQEGMDHQDILQVDIHEGYSNLTLKSIAMLQWVTRTCPGVKYILKCDDDVFINLETLITDLQHTVHSRFIMGEIIAGAKPMRDNSSKWRTPVSTYSSSTYPVYLSGAAYVISGDLVPDLHVAALKTSFFWIEDIFITAFCAKQVGAKHLFNAKFHNRRTLADPCLWKNAISVHRVSSEELIKGWLTLTSQSCQ